MKDKLITNKKFPILLGFTALFIALCAACFSVYGIGSLFAGAAVSAMIMAGSLELGKLVATTFLYRYWNKTVGLIKTYLTIAVVALMVITSAGIFGFLSSAYQKSSLTFKLTQDRITNIEQSKGYYTNLIGTSQERIRVLNETRKVQEDRLSTALKDPILTRNVIQLKQIQDQTIKLIDQSNEDIKTENGKIEESRNKIQKIDEDINSMKIGATEKKDIQTFRFLADALHTDLDTVSKWFIISLIFVFDPLSIALILAYNVAVYKKEDDKVTINTKPEPLKESTSVTISEKVETIDSPKLEIGSVVESPTVESLKEVKENLNVPVIEPSKETVSEHHTQPLISSQMDDFYKRMFKR